jgi:hypothetical protein
MAHARTNQVQFWADTLAKASVDELEALRRALSHSDSSSNLVFMVQAEITRRERRAVWMSRVVEA